MRGDGLKSGYFQFLLVNKKKLHGINDNLPIFNNDTVVKYQVIYKIVECFFFVCAKRC